MLYTAKPLIQKNYLDIPCCFYIVSGMDWKALIAGELKDSDLWLLSIFDRVSAAAQAAEWRRFTSEHRRFMPPFILVALVAVAAVLAAVLALLARRPPRPLVISPARLPAAGIMLAARLLPVPRAARRG